MIPRHHPSDAVLADYASGAQRPAFAAVTAAHLQACVVCRAQVALLEGLGGALLDGMEPSPLSPGAADTALSRLGERAGDPGTAAGPLTSRIRFGRRRWIAPRVWMRKAEPQACGSDLLYLLRMPQGMSTIPHSHTGCEHTGVLKGAFSDETGVYRAGDFAEISDETHHQPYVEEKEDCICLVASEGRMLTQGVIGRLVQALAGV